MLDLVVSAVGLVLLSPVLAVVGLVVRCDSPGPALFRQQRVGRGGQPFTIHKFRTMRVDAGGPLVTVGGESRITRSGIVLRASKLDEMPQLYDVLRGAMSLVGPRPEVAEYVALWPAEHRDLILSVRPGITDPVSLELRDEQGLLAEQDEPETYYREVLLPWKAEHYAAYVRGRTLRGDLGIIARTVWAVVRR
nr:sugar transferase [Nocardioides sp. MAH-18]